MNEIIEDIIKGEEGWEFERRETNVVCYEADTVLIANEDNLQRLFCELQFLAWSRGVFKHSNISVFGQLDCTSCCSDVMHIQYG
jgi:hypothetical protein